MAIKIADYLPHTPVTAFGANFLFETTSTDVSTPMNKLLQLNDVDELTEFGASIKSLVIFDQKERIGLQV